MGDTVKITKKTRCWICGRNSEQLKNVIEAYWESGELGKNMNFDACFEIVSIEKFCSNEKMQIPICQICSALILQHVVGYLAEELEVTVEIPKPKVKVVIGDEDV